MEEKNLSWLDILTIASFMLGYENLMENRSQSEQSDKLIKQNDVQTANDKQAQYLLVELRKQFDEQNEMLRKILEVLTSEDHSGPG